MGFFAVATMAFSISGAAWPALVTSTPELKSSHLLPHLSNTCTPRALSQMIRGWPAIEIGSYLRSISTIGLDAGTGMGVFITRFFVLIDFTLTGSNRNSFPISFSSTLLFLLNSPPPFEKGGGRARLDSLSEAGGGSPLHSGAAAFHCFFNILYIDRCGVAGRGHGKSAMRRAVVHRFFRGFAFHDTIDEARGERVATANAVVDLEIGTLYGIVELAISVQDGAPIVD